MMKIAIDLRSLSSGSVSGVENYVLNLTEHLLAMDKKNSYTLFYNSWKKDRPDVSHYINSQIRHTRWPNKLLNACLKLNLVKLEKLIGEFDVLFMPNLNQFSISAKAKLVITVHDLSPVVAPKYYDFKRSLWHEFLNYGKSFSRANLILAVSEYTKKDLIRLFGVPSEKIKVVYPGIDHAIFHPDISHKRLREARNLYGLPGNYILFLSTIEPRKNLTALIEAFNELDSPANLVIAGRPGWKYRKIFRAINKSKKLKRIHYIGYLDEQDKPAIMKLARAVVYPSFYEGFGFVPVEAQSVGVPAIASAVTALPEVVGSSALMVNPYSVASLTKALADATTNENLRKSLIDKGLENSKKYTWENTAKMVLEAVERASH